MQVTCGWKGYLCISITTCPCINTSYALWLCLVVCLLIILVEICFFVFAFYHLFLFVDFDQSFSSFMSKIQKPHKKYKIKKFDRHCWVFVSKLVLPCTFVLMALCIYERSLFLCTLIIVQEILKFVTVVNRSSNLSWMISKWLCWSWDMHWLVPIYLPTLYFFCFC